MPESGYVEVRVDRISNRGNPIARGKYDGSSIHIPGGEVGKSYTVKLFSVNDKYTVGLKKSFSRRSRQNIIENYETILNYNCKYNPANKSIAKYGSSNDYSAKRLASKSSETVTTENGFAKMKNKNDLLNGNI